MWFGIHLVRQGLITPEQLFTAVEEQAARRPPLGELAVRRGKLKMSEVFRILGKQAEERRSFGSIARELRLLTKRQLADLLLAQTEMTPALSQVLVDLAMIPQDIVDFETARARDGRLDACLPISTSKKPTAKGKS